jgi:hypothetical protein
LPSPDVNTTVRIVRPDATSMPNGVGLIAFGCDNDGSVYP